MGMIMEGFLMGAQRRKTILWNGTECGKRPFRADDTESSLEGYVFSS
jgi:hypothetical protein